MAEKAAAEAVEVILKEAPEEDGEGAASGSA
mgnify:FL=1